MDDSVQVREAARVLIQRHEGYTQFPKSDAKGTVQIGFGTNLTLRGLSRGEADWLLIRDVQRLLGWFDSFPFFARMTVNRKVALIDMAYNLGEEGIDRFARMLAMLDEGNYERAADEMLHSVWAGEVGTRAIDDAEMMRRG